MLTTIVILIERVRIIEWYLQPKKKKNTQLDNNK